VTATVAQVLGGPVLAEATLLGGADGRHRAVTEVLACRLDASLDVDLPAGAAVVLDRPDGYQVELFLPRARAAGVSLVVVCWPSATPLLSSTPWLADRLTLPVLVARDVAAVNLAMRLRAVVHAPETDRGLVCARVAERLATARETSPAHVVDVLDAALPARCAVLGAESAPLAGPLPAVDLRPVLRGGVAATIRNESDAVVAVPVGPAGRPLSSLWLVAETAALTDAELATVRAALSVAAWAVAAWSATQQLDTARDNAFHTLVLSELLTAGDQVSPRTAEHAVQAGWSLDGWHIGVRLLPAGRDQPVPPAVRRTLVEQGITGPVVELGDGWACWVSQRFEPAPDRFRAVVDAVTRVLDTPMAANLVAGIGQPQPGPGGLAKSLTEAWDLARIAGFSRSRRRVEHADAADPRRLILASVAGDETLRRSRRLLGELLAPANAVLLETLETYLSLESSPTATATRLAVHRNTILKRLERIEHLLDVRMTDPTVRLALRIACSATR
jgi:PucR family transcriptional regulator, purine catabolism regulatory protein